MRTVFPILWTVIISLFVLVSCSEAGTVSVFVPGYANPYLAGMPNGAGASNGDVAPNQSPVLVAGLNINAVSTLTFSANGSASYGDSNSFGPDGGLFQGGFISKGSEHGISGVRVTISALIGVFLNSELPTTTAAPADLNFEVLSRDFTTLSPELKQVFFIGDGITSSSVTQKFYVPVGATRLFLGTADGIGWYNNGGGFNVNISSESQAAVPEPSTMAIFGLGVLGMAYRARRKAKA